MDIEKLIEPGSIKNELDYQRAMVADRRLRLLAKTSNHFKNLRARLRDLIEDYENRVWSKEDTIKQELIEQSDQAKLSLKRKGCFSRKEKNHSKKNERFRGLLPGHKSKRICPN